MDGRTRILYSPNPMSDDGAGTSISRATGDGCRRPPPTIHIPGTQRSSLTSRRQSQSHPQTGRSTDCHTLLQAAGCDHRLRKFSNGNTQRTERRTSSIESDPDPSVTSQICPRACARQPTKRRRGKGRKGARCCPGWWGTYLLFYLRASFVFIHPSFQCRPPTPTSDSLACTHATHNYDSQPPAKPPPSTPRTSLRGGESSPGFW